MLWSSVLGCRNGDPAGSQFEIMTMASLTVWETTFPHWHFHKLGGSDLEQESISLSSGPKPLRGVITDHSGPFKSGLIAIVCRIRFDNGWYAQKGSGFVEFSMNDHMGIMTRGKT
jgi:hypothetical protein